MAIQEHILHAVFSSFRSLWIGLKPEHARNGADNHTSVFLPFRDIYLQLLLQDFNKDFMLISKNTESCRLNIVSRPAAIAAAAAAAAAAVAGGSSSSVALSLRAAVPSPTGSRVLALGAWLHYHAVPSDAQL